MWLCLNVFGFGPLKLQRGLLWPFIVRYLQSAAFLQGVGRGGVRQVLLYQPWLSCLCLPSVGIKSMQDPAMLRWYSKGECVLDRIWL